MKTSALKRAKILLLGDSITQQSFDTSSCGWGTCVANRYQRRADVLNRGYSGYNTDWFLRLAATDAGRSDLFDHENVMLVTIFFGANDASDPTLNGRQHVPIVKYESNIKDIVALTRSNFGEDVGIILISPPPVCHDGRLRFQKESYGDGATGKLERTLELSGAYARSAARVANEMGVPFLDLWTGMQERENWRDFLSDGLHFSSLGNAFVGAAVLDTIDRYFPRLSVKPAPDTGNINSLSTCSSMRTMGPWHDEIDITKPDRCFES
jgi:lysophospholipase L1-like esterase